jgi:diguanylate cyclase (GGDEF)-like protein
MSYIPTTFTNALFFQPARSDLPDALGAWMSELELPVITVTTIDDLVTQALRGRPRFIMLDGRHDLTAAVDACRRIKQDAYMGIAPAFVLTRGTHAELLAAYGALADEVLIEGESTELMRMRLVAALHRSDRDVEVHPSTRLPGATSIQREIAARMSQPFAVCYADLDHFKEFNDRYSYTEGDRVIRILATLLHDTVKGLCGDAGFVGHIGGDDFIFIIPRARLDEVCSDIVATFDELIVYQYSEHDRRAGYFFGKDRRGQLHRVPLMTLSIGVVTNDRRTFESAEVVSQLATEMKTYAKTLPGSVYAVDRRTDDRASSPLTPPLMGAVTPR